MVHLPRPTWERLTYWFAFSIVIGLAAFVLSWSLGALLNLMESPVSADK